MDTNAAAPIMFRTLADGLVHVASYVPVVIGGYPARALRLACGDEATGSTVDATDVLAECPKCLAIVDAAAAAFDAAAEAATR